MHMGFLEDMEFSGAGDPMAALAEFDVGAADCVGAADYVGAAQLARAGSPAASMIARQAAAQNASNAARLMKAGAVAIGLQRRVANDRKLRNQALAGYLPSCMVPISTAQGTTIALSAAFTLSGAAGVPYRPIKYGVEPAIASFFGISSITGGRMNMVAGGTGLVPATRFLPNSVQMPLDNPELGGGVPIFVVGANLDAGAAHPYLSWFDVIDLTKPSQRMT